jgi:sugar/nucleoside kinase (ribokinase family)
MKKKLDVVVVGELNVDLILVGLPSLPEMGQCKLSKDVQFTLGSASAIFACNIAKLGKQVGFVGKIGDDDFGTFILESLKARNVDVSHIIRDKKGKTGICVSLSFQDNYAMASYPGVRELMSIADVDFEYVKSASHLHMSSYFLQPAMKEGCPELFKTARKNGLSTSLDPDSDPHNIWSDSIYQVLDHVDIFLPNEREALKITGSNDIKSALDILAEKVNTVVIKKGKDGAIAQHEDKRLSAEAFEIEVVDTTGAGDSFNAGFICQYLNRAGIEECLKWGNACAAISTTKPGGTTAFPAYAEVVNFIEKRKVETKELIKYF